MSQIIVTVFDKSSRKEYDMDVPNDLRIDNLLDDITQALAGAEPGLSWDLSRVKLASPKLGRQLYSIKTLKEEGIWNGDYLVIED